MATRRRPNQSTTTLRERDIERAQTMVDLLATIITEFRETSASTPRVVGLHEFVECMWRAMPNRQLSPYFLREICASHALRGLDAVRGYEDGDVDRRLSVVAQYGRILPVAEFEAAIATGIVNDCRRYAPDGAPRLSTDIVRAFLDTRRNKGGRGRRANRTPTTALADLLNAAGFPPATGARIRRSGTKPPAKKRRQKTP